MLHLKTKHWAYVSCAAFIIFGSLHIYSCDMQQDNFSFCAYEDLFLNVHRAHNRVAVSEICELRVYVVDKKGYHSERYLQKHWGTSGRITSKDDIAKCINELDNRPHINAQGAFVR
jgi:hypothetical protein